MSEEVFDVAVIGASVAGSRTAGIIAAKGYSVLLLEEHPQIGFPCKCTGLVSWRLRKILPELPNKIIVNEIDRAKFFSPRGKQLELQAKNRALVIDRPALDKFLFAKAKKKGVTAKLGEKFISYHHRKDEVKITTSKGTYRAKILVGADGGNSSVAKSAGLSLPKDCLVGLQATVDGSFACDSVELWFGSKVSPNFFAWVVPENEKSARVGLASNPSPVPYYKKFLQKRIGRSVKPNVGGIIRRGLMKTTVAERVMLVGDAAGQIKPYSGGGIIYGLTASPVCAEAAAAALNSGKFSQGFFEKQYDAAWKRKLATPIKRGLWLSRALSSPDPLLNFLFATARFGKKVLNNLDMDLIDYFV